MKTVGKSWTIRTAMVGLIVLAVGFPAQAKTIFEDEVFLVSCNGFPGHAKRRFRIEQNNQRNLRIEISNAPAGSYGVIIDGVNRGTINVSNLGNGEIEYDTSPQLGEFPFNFAFDVDTEVDLFFGTRVAYSLTNDSACQTASGGGGSTSTTTQSSSTTSTSSQSSSTTNQSSSTTTQSSSTTSTSQPGQSCQALENRVTLVRCAARAPATGFRRVRTHVDCDQDLTVEIEKVPAGNYSVYVTDTDGRVKRGTIHFVSRSAEIEFDDEPAVNELPLTFNPFGPLEVVSDATGRTMFAYPRCP